MKIEEKLQHKLNELIGGHTDSLKITTHPDEILIQNMTKSNKGQSIIVPYKELKELAKVLLNIDKKRLR